MQYIKEYNEQGYTKLNNFLTKYEIDHLNNLLDDICKNAVPSDTVFFEGSHPKQIQYLMNYDKAFQNVIDKLYPIAVNLTGCEDLTILNMQMFEKHPQISKPTRSHQDNAYFKVTPAIATTFWISLDYIDKENGSLYYSPKSNLYPTQKHSRYNNNTTFRIRSGVPGLSMCLPDHDESLDVCMITNPGDVLIHNCNTIHRAGKNNSNKRRRAIGVVFIPKICKIDERLKQYFDEQLLGDILLQKNNNPELYEKIKKM